VLRAAIDLQTAQASLSEPIPEWAASTPPSRNFPSNIGHEPEVAWYLPDEAPEEF
jgi:hypothetical protein